ncbi:hypothetical protein M9H77_02611 [Catharanthus roseus]|uniref:Uncharacterized protein n=1 Tax=Catharanthus roseus TaxID=4058 RepID=A0ACC0C903_CATRO|nr:hypothetical protein M9H77_02611 [Catharanthus roseus]
MVVPFKLKDEQMAMCENWQLFVHDRRHNHAIGVYTDGHAQAAKLTEEQLKQTEQCRKSHVPPRNILRFFREQNVGCAVKKYITSLRRLRRIGWGRNTVEEVLCLSAQQGYTVFYRNCEDNNVLSDVVVAHSTLIEMMRTWPYVLIMDTTYKTNNHLALKRIWLEISRAPEIIDDPKYKCGHYMRISHGFPCSCELITRFDHMLPIQLVDIEAFWKKLEIGSWYPSAQQHDIDSEMHSLINLLH